MNLQKIANRETIINRVLAWEWHYVCQRRRGNYAMAHQLQRCQLIIERMEVNGWLP